MSISPKQQKFIDAMAASGTPIADSYSRSDLNEIANSIGMKYAPAWIVQDSSRRADRGFFRVPEHVAVTSKPTGTTDFDRAMQTPDPPKYGYSMNDADGNEFKCDQQGNPAPAPVMNAIMGMTGGERSSLVPSKMGDYVAWGHFKNVESVIRSNFFAPIFITGMSGNGKTTMIEQACAKAKRECFRVNITTETDEDDLIGGFRLVNGETKFVYGPVVEAMQRGSVLLLDEIDLASSKIMCLQPVLEGKGVFVKKIGEWITPKQGFTVIATANTKGKGSEDGRFIGTNVLNEAFLERFAVTFEQSYPTPKTEIQILSSLCQDKAFCKHLVDWADIIRKTFFDGGIDEVISTRRLVHIVRAYSIFDNKAKALEVCINRFDDETKAAFIELYDKVDEDFQMIDKEADS